MPGELKSTQALGVVTEKARGSPLDAVHAKGIETLAPQYGPSSGAHAMDCATAA